jgi:hypothetical protein
MNNILKKLGMGLGAFILIYLVIVTPILMWVWSDEPDTFNVQQITKQMAEKTNQKVVSGSHIMATTINMADILLNKSGGYLSNDLMYPSIIMDNIPRWEFGVVEIQRSVALVLRKELSRSQSQSIENKALVKAQTAYNNNHSEWVFPSAESKYSEAREGLTEYMKGMSDNNQPDVQFYSRADNLGDLLKEFNSKLGSLSKKLGAATKSGSVRENTDLANDSTAKQSTVTASKIVERTPWGKIDDNFYEARGQSWAMLHILKAAKYDFEEILNKKNAHPSLDQIIKELEGTQKPMNSLFIMNGTGYGSFANHSLIMANYISMANTAIKDMIDLLEQG